MNDRPTKDRLRPGPSPERIIDAEHRLGWHELDELEARGWKLVTTTHRTSRAGQPYVRHTFLHVDARPDSGG